MFGAVDGGGLFALLIDKQGNFMGLGEKGSRERVGLSWRERRVCVKGEDWSNGCFTALYPGLRMNYDFEADLRRLS